MRSKKQDIEEDKACFAVNQMHNCLSGERQFLESGEISQRD